MCDRLLLSLVLMAVPLTAQVTSERLLHPEREPQNWLTYSGNYSGTRYSPLDQISRANVRDLELKWVYHPHVVKPNQIKIEVTPIVVDGVLYAGNALEVSAIDAVTGRIFWTVRHALDPKAYYNAYETNKGLGVGGNTVYWATIDCHLIAIDAKTGVIQWDTVMADWQKGYQYNVPPLVVKDKVILGPATNEMGSNCWVAAYDAKTGKEVWRTWTAPQSADDPAAKSWVGDSWKHAGNPIWNAGSYDPETNLTFWGIGNPNPGWNGDTRLPADNLYSDSVIALDADTGKLKWYFQFTPGDEYDWDSTQVPVLADMQWKGQPRKVMMWANRNGHFYVLDRTDGKFLMAKPFVKQNWEVGIDENGRPIKAPGMWPKPQGRVYVEPGTQGGTNWYPPSFSPHTGLFYLSVWANYSAYSPKYDAGPWTPRKRYSGSTPPPGTPPPPAGANARLGAGFRSEDEGYGAIFALDPATGERKWQFKMVGFTENGVLSTGGDLVFGGGMDGDFVALDGRTGELLWHVNLGGANASGPMSYAVNGKQYVVGTGEGAVYAFGLPDRTQ